jgi:hypothetical protein
MAFIPPGSAADSLSRSDIRQAETLQPAGRPRRQGVEDRLEDADEIELPGLNPAEQVGRLADQRSRDQQHRQDHDEENNQHGCQRRQIAVAAPVAK